MFSGTGNLNLVCTAIIMSIGVCKNMLFSILQLDCDGCVLLWLQVLWFVAYCSVCGTGTESSNSGMSFDLKLNALLFLHVNKVKIWCKIDNVM